MCIDRPCSLDEYAKTEIQIHVYWKLWNAKKIRFNFDWVFFGESKSWHSLKLGRRSLLRKSEHQKTNQNTKEHQKICKPSLHRKSLFSWSLLLQSEHRKWLFGWSLHRKSLLFSSSLLRKSERWKECEKEHRKSQFCLIFTFWLPMAKVPMAFWQKKNYNSLTWLNLT